MLKEPSKVGSDDIFNTQTNTTSINEYTQIIEQFIKEVIDDEKEIEFKKMLSEALGKGGGLHDLLFSAESKKPNEDEAFNMVCLIEEYFNVLHLPDDIRVGNSDEEILLGENWKDIVRLIRSHLKIDIP